MQQTVAGRLPEALPQPFAAAPSPAGPQPSPAIINLVRSQVQALLQATAAFHQLPPDQRRALASNMVKIAAYSAALTQDEWAQSKRLGQTPMRHEQTVLTPLIGLTPEAIASAAAQPGGSAPYPNGQEPAGHYLRPGAYANGNGSAGARTGRVPATAASLSAPDRRPVVRAAADADEFSPRAVSRVAGITRETLNAVAFPTFVADLIKGTFSAIVDASIKQMEAYMKLLENVAGTVNQFMANNISDNQARDYVAAMHPELFRVDISGKQPALRLRDGADDVEPKPDFRADYGLNGEIELSDETAEEVLVPAARRKLAQTRQQVLATMVMMGINRIVITSGKIRASMKFHIDASDTATAKSASQFDFKNETTASYGAGGFSWFGGGFASVSTKNSIAYVSSESKEATDEINVSTDLNSEVEIKFKSDYFPMEKLATPEMIAAIQGNTANPAANARSGQPAQPGQPAAAPAAPARA